MPHRLRSSSVAVAAVLTSLAGASTADAAMLQMPFKCGVTVNGEARANHDPSAAIDFNGLGGGDTDLGMPVVAAGAGRITISTYYKTNGYGNAIEIDHGDGRRTFYAHLRSRRYGVGTVVKRGQRIGRLGKSSAKYTFSAHLHYEMRRGGSAVQAWFNGRPAPVYSRMEQSVRMTSRNCRKKRKPAPAPAPAPQPQPQPQPPAPQPQPQRGVALPNSSFRREATVRTDNGLAVAGRMGPRTAAAKVNAYRNGDKVKIVCQKRGERVSGKFGTSNLWNLVAIGNGRGVYVTDTYVYTGSDGKVAPACP